MIMRLTITFLLLSCVLNTGCLELERRALGTRVHQAQHQGITYTHCSILMSSRQPEMARDAIKECEDAVAGQH